MLHDAVDRTISDLLDRVCDEHGNRPAVVDGDIRLTFRQLRGRVAALAVGLHRSGVGSGDRVAFLLPVGVDWVTLFYALMHIGAIAVPLNLTWTEREIAQGLERTDATVLVATQAFRGRDYAAGARSLGAGEISAGQRFRRLRLLLTDGNGEPGSLEELMSRGAEGNAADYAELGAEVDPDTPAMYLLTSGTTDFPKPVRHVHESILAGIAHFADGLEAAATDSMLIIAPNYHVAAYLALLTPHMCGAAVHLVPHFLPRQALEVIEREQITMLFGFDVHFLAMKRDPMFELFDFSSVQRTMIGSNPASFDDIEAMGVGHQGNIYGSSEYMAAQAFLPYRDRRARDRMRRTHDRPSLGTQLRIVDVETGTALPAGERGEICVRGPALFRGYYNMPEETAAAFDPDGFFHSGDLGHLDDAGYLYYEGRLKDMVKTGGENVSVQEVELYLQLETPWVQRALVVGVPDPRWGEAVTALVEYRPGVKPSADEVRDACRADLAGYKIPKHVLSVGADEWVVTPTGKVDRQAMMQWADQRITNSGTPDE